MTERMTLVEARKLAGEAGQVWPSLPKHLLVVVDSAAWQQF
jgi:hypothetical protein